ncbi:MAG: LysR substrate-binding domain-containing protein [Microbacterium sp.]
MFDPQLLRAFVALAETRSFTRAAERLQSTQSTVSQQIQRLERAAGRTLALRDTRSVELTDNGEAMLGFARVILGAHDAAASYFDNSAMRGRLRFGSADDLALTELPAILREFRRLNPQIDLVLTVGQSGSLARRLGAGQFDLVYVKQEPGLPHGHLVRRDRHVWVAHESTRLDPGSPVPLIAYPSPSPSRDAAIRALDSTGRNWRITCNVRDVNGALAAVRAGIGFAVLPRATIPTDLTTVSPRYGLPRLDEIDFALLTNPRSARGPVDALSAAIIGHSHD